MSQLGKMATDDIILPSAQAGQNPMPVKERAPYNNPRNNPIPGVYRSRLPNGKFTNLMQVMFTDFCKMDCHFCPNSHWVPRKRYAFKVDELAKTFIELAERHTVDGLFLSSGVAGTGTKTTERMVQGRRHHPQQIPLQRLHPPQSNARRRAPHRRSRTRTRNPTLRKPRDHNRRAHEQAQQDEALRARHSCPHAVDRRTQKRSDSRGSRAGDSIRRRCRR